MLEFAEIIELTTKYALTLGLSAWVVRFVLSAMLGEYKGRWTY